MSGKGLQRRIERVDTGLTLIELLVAVVLLGGVTAAVLVTLYSSLGSAQNTTQRVRQSNDAQIISTWLVRDAQAAGGINPSTGSTDGNLGASTTPLSGDCGLVGGDRLLVSFRWIDRTVNTNPTTVATYAIISGTNQMRRSVCLNGGAASSQVLAKFVDPLAASSFATCDTTGCTLTVTEAAGNSSGQFSPAPAMRRDLRASFRPETQSFSGAPDPPQTNYYPVHALGSCASGTPGVNLSGGNGIAMRVNGPVVLNMTNSGSCNPIDGNGNGTYVAERTNVVVGTVPSACGINRCPTPIVLNSPPLADPYAGLLVPGVGTCGQAPLVNPPQIGLDYQPGVYRNPANFTPGNSTFAPGIYVFCQRVTVSGITANNVVFYFDTGSSIVAGGTSIITNNQTGTGARYPAVWWPSSSGLDLTSCGTCDWGAVYAPNAVASFGPGGGGGLDARIDALIARGLSFQGSPNVVIGPPWLRDLTLDNSNGTVAQGDTIVLTFSEGDVLNPQSICSTWPTSGDATQTANTTVTITDAGANDVLTFGSTACTLNVGSLALNADYVSATRVFGTAATSSTLAWNAAARTLTVQLGAPSVAGGTYSGVAAATPAFTPSALLRTSTGAAVYTGPFSPRDTAGTLATHRF